MLLVVGFFVYQIKTKHLTDTDNLLNSILIFVNIDNFSGFRILSINILEIQSQYCKIIAIC